MGSRANVYPTVLLMLVNNSSFMPIIIVCIKLLNYTLRIYLICKIVLIGAAFFIATKSSGTHF